MYDKILNTNHGRLNEDYLERIESVIQRSLNEFPRTMAVRIDLRLPDNERYNVNPNLYPKFLYSWDSRLISRFTESLKAQIRSDQLRKMKEGKRVHFCRLRYCWVREVSDTDKFHYHVLLLLNKDTYAFLGKLKSNKRESNLITKIRKAWGSALCCTYETSEQLVYVPENPCYYLDRNNSKFKGVYRDILYRSSYLAKDKTKPYGDGYRSFGCSQY